MRKEVPVDLPDHASHYFFGYLVLWRPIESICRNKIQHEYSVLFLTQSTRVHHEPFSQSYLDRRKRRSMITGRGFSAISLPLPVIFGTFPAKGVNLFVTQTQLLQSFRWFYRGIETCWSISTDEIELSCYANNVQQLNRTSFA